MLFLLALLFRHCIRYHYNAVFTENQRFFGEFFDHKLHLTDKLNWKLFTLGVYVAQRTDIFLGIQKICATG
jgi:hypothetical protein